MYGVEVRACWIGVLAEERDVVQGLELSFGLRAGFGIITLLFVSYIYTHT